ncbi:MAG: hypothetical protein ACTTH7_09640 [Treponema sp.]
MKYNVCASIAVCAVIFAVTCSFEPPSVQEYKIQRLYFRDVRGLMSEQLSVFVVFRDKDGKNDYKSLTLSEDATGLQWTITRDTTVFLQETSRSEKEQWVGSNKFLYPRGPFPKGSYHIMLSDLSGNEATLAVQLGEPINFSSNPFDFQCENGSWLVKVHDTTICSRFQLIVLGADMQPLYTESLSGIFSGTLSELLEKAEGGRYIQCLGENNSGSAGFISPALIIAD